MQDYPSRFKKESINSVALEKKEKQSKINKFLTFHDDIQYMEQHKMFEKDKNIYENLHSLRDIRNHVHIQKSKRNEKNNFTNKILGESEKTLEYVLKYMIEEYPRKTSKYIFNDLPFPWKRHL